MLDALSCYVGNADLVGITCLAKGPDQLFAEIVLDLGGKIESIIPASDYDQIPDPASRARYAALIRRSTAVHKMPFATSGPAAYMAANKDLIRRSELIVAVWDGGPPDGRGGTADAVDYATRCQREVVVIWPAGAERS
jgi:hypothetical protein